MAPVSFPRLARCATVAREIHFNGIGLHSGKPSTIALMPRFDQDSRICFLRKGTETTIDAHFGFVNTSTPLCTELRTSDGNGQVVAKTVEHLIAALYGLGITSCCVQVDSDSGEIPILDGSARDFAAKISSEIVNWEENGFAAHLPTVLINRTVCVEDSTGESFAQVSPRNNPCDTGPTIECSLSVDSFHNRLPDDPNLSQIKYTHTFGNEDDTKQFLLQIASARTFAFKDDVNAMRNAGLALGGSLENAVVFVGNGTRQVLNEEGLRFEDEWVRHKLLDVFGDLGLTISRYGILHGNFEFFRPGHALTNKLLHAVFEDKQNFSLLK